VSWRLAALPLLWLLALANAQAQAGAACVPLGTPAQRNACAVRDWQASDAALSIRYNAVMQSLPAAQRPALRREHSAWMQARQADCHAATRNVDRQIDASARYHACLVAQNHARQQALLSRPSP
jgi:uncharacterized protein YecT (DUF1311 family)